MTEKRCIFHIPNKLNEVGTSGSQVRPRKMMQAFRNIGYEVDVVMGYGSERKIAIEDIKKKIKSGVKYDFLYSENSTMPTLLTEKHHLPTYPTLDFGFLHFCKRHGIRIGLFYRDIYWRFPIYSRAVTGIKRIVAQLAYRYDLYEYIRLLDVFYTPSVRVQKYLRREKLNDIMEELPPGSDIDEDILSKKNIYYDNKVKQGKGGIELFYVGGMGSQYAMDKLFEAVDKVSDVHATICCREKEWNSYKNRVEKYMTDKITIVHKFGEELIEHYMSADICLMFFEPSEYGGMAMPIKLFEYLSYAIPIIAQCDCVAADFVESEDIGWSIEYDTDVLAELLIELVADYQKIYDKHMRALESVRRNRWEDRALKVERDLKG